MENSTNKHDFIKPEKYTRSGLFAFSTSDDITTKQVLYHNCFTGIYTTTIWYGLIQRRRLRGFTEFKLSRNSAV